jgi:hypothetical protein
MRFSDYSCFDTEPITPGGEVRDICSNWSRASEIDAIVTARFQNQTP